MMFTEETVAGDKLSAAISPFGRLIKRLIQVDFATAQGSAVTRILAEAPIDDRSLSRFIKFVPDRHARNGVYRNECFELVVMCWPANVRSAIHEHGGSRGFVRVERGSLVSENYTIVESDAEAGIARLSLGVKRTMAAGEVDIVVPGDDVHRVGAANGVAAITLHLYARPLDAFFVFDEGRQTRRAATTRYDIQPSTIDLSSTFA